MSQLLGLLRRRAGSGQERASDTEESENNVVLERKVKELEEVDETAFRKLIASAVEQSRCMWILEYASQWCQE